jgi:hypothetical protein
VLQAGGDRRELEEFDKPQGLSPRVLQAGGDRRELEEFDKPEGLSPRVLQAGGDRPSGLSVESATIGAAAQVASQ